MIEVALRLLRQAIPRPQRNTQAVGHIVGRVGVGRHVARCPKEVVVQSGAQWLLAEPGVGERLVEAHDRTMVHVDVGAVPAVHTEDCGFTAESLCVDRWTSERLRPVGRQPTGVIGVVAVFECVAHHRVGKDSSMPCLGQAHQPNVSTRRLEDADHPRNMTPRFRSVKVALGRPRNAYAPRRRFALEPVARIQEMAGEQGPTGYRARAATALDLDAIVRLTCALDASLGLPPSPTREFLQSIWRLSATDLARDTRIIERDQVVAGFAQGIWRQERGGPLDLLVYVHPDQQGNGIATALLSWGESLGRQRGAEGVRAEVPETDLAGHVLLRSRGYHRVRSAFTMAKTLGEDEVVRPDPAGVTIRRYAEGDERALFEVHEASFADHWGFRPSTFEAFSDELRAFGLDPSLVFLAEAKVGVVGHVVSFLDENEGFIGMLGVIDSWRGRGIAKALLRRVFVEISTRDRTQVKLGVDAQNPHGAVALYQSVGMTVERQLDIFEIGPSESAALPAGLGGLS